MSSPAWNQTETIKQLELDLSEASSDTTRLRLMNDLCWEYIRSNQEAGIELGKKSILLAEEIGDNIRLQNAYRYLCETYIKHNQLDSAKAMIDLAIEINTNDDIALGKIYINIAMIHEKSGDYGGALSNYFKSLELFEKSDYHFGVGWMKNVIGNIYTRRSDFKTAIRYAEEAYQIFENLHSPQQASKSLLILGDSYQGLKDYDKALEYLNISLELLEGSDYPFEYSGTLDGIGSVYLEMGNYDKALEYLKQALAIDDTLNSSFYQAISYGNIAMAYSGKGDYEKAIEYNRKALELAKMNGTLDILLSATEYSAQYYSKMGNFQLAYEYRLLYDDIKDSLYSTAKSAQIIDITTKYETQKKEQEIERLLAERENAESEMIFRNAQLIALSVLLVVLIIIAVLYVRMRTAKEQKRLNELENKALRAQMNPHFIFNCLNSIQRLYVEGKEDLANDYMADFSSLLRRILENSGMEKISLKEEIRSTVLYLDLEKMRTDHAFDYTITVDPSIDQLNRFMPPLILQPYVENAIWHGIIPKKEKGKIDIQIEQNSRKELICTIRDNGVGFQKKNQRDKEGSSKGMSITEKRLGGHRALDIKELAEGGIQIKIRIK